MSILALDGDIEGFLLGDVSAEAVYMGSVEVWTGFTPILWTDDFNRANGTLSTEDYTYKNGTYPRISGNVLFVGASSNGSYEVLVNQVPAGGDIFTEVTFAAANNSTPSALILGGSNDNGIHALLFVNSNSLGIYTSTGWAGAGLTAQANYVGIGRSFAVGDVIRFVRVGNVYTGYLNDTEIVQWVDETELVPLTNVLGGIMQQRGFFANSASYDDLRFGDVAAI